MIDEVQPWMERALQLAERARGRTSPNPPVGAVVVQGNTVVGEGWTQPPGGPHAEVVALEQAGSAAQGAQLFVTLEPCTFWGRTPPCTDSIIKAGMRQVFFAARDPDRRIGAGAQAVLDAAGIATTQLRAYTARAEEQIAAFRCWTQQHRPLVIAKYAMTLDGKIATWTRDSRWVSGPAARRLVHQLRDEVDAILVGVGTVVVDDPALTTRFDAAWWRDVQHPIRVIVDSHGRTPLSANVLDRKLPGQTIIATVDAAGEWQAEVERRGAEVLRLPPDTDGRVDLHALLRELGQRNLTSLLVEGGAQILGRFAAEQVIDRIWAFVAPKLIGGAIAPGPMGHPGVALMNDAQPWRFVRHEVVGDDLLIIAEPASTSTPTGEAKSSE